MAGTGWLVRDGFAGRCTWAFDGETLLLTPEGHPAEAHLLREVQGLGGADEHTVELTVSGRTVTLSRLGGDGPTLRERLARTWLPARAQALRLTGSGEPPTFTGAITDGGAARPFRALLFDDVLAFATPGCDVQPLFLARLATVACDRPAYRVIAAAWGGAAVTFSRLGGETEAFSAALAARRQGLAAEAAAVLAAHLPALAPGARAALGSAWLPGRLLALPDLERTATGIAPALRAGWFAALPRAAHAETLLAWAAAGKAFLGYSRPVPEAAEEDDGAEAPASPGDAASATSAPNDPTAPLWLLAGRADGWLLECLSLGDHATYRFAAGDEVPELVEQLLCAPQFSRTALYRPLEGLVGAQAEFAPAARDLPFLRALRACFAGRIIHTSLATWQQALG